MTTKLIGMITNYELLLHTESCDLWTVMQSFDCLVAWQIKFFYQNADSFKGTFLENSNIFETNRKHYIPLSLKVIWQLNLIGRPCCCYFAHSHLIFDLLTMWLFKKISSVFRFIWLRNLVEWSVMMSCYYHHGHVTLWSNGCMTN